MQYVRHVASCTVAGFVRIPPRSKRSPSCCHSPTYPEYGAINYYGKFSSPIYASYYTRQSPQSRRKVQMDSGVPANVQADQANSLVGSVSQSLRYEAGYHRFRQRLIGFLSSLAIKSLTASSNSSNTHVSSALTNPEQRYSHHEGLVIVFAVTKFHNIPACSE